MSKPTAKEVIAIITIFILLFFVAAPMAAIEIMLEDGIKIGYLRGFVLGNGTIFFVCYGAWCCATTADYFNK